MSKTTMEILPACCSLQCEKNRTCNLSSTIVMLAFCIETLTLRFTRVLQCEGTLSQPSRRGRLFWTSSKRLASTQTKTSALLVPNASVARKCCSAKASELPDRTSSLLAPSVSVAVKSCSSPIPTSSAEFRCNSKIPCILLKSLDCSSRSSRSCESQIQKHVCRVVGKIQRNCSRPCSM